MGTGVGEFAGKFAFASTAPGGPRYLTAVSWSRDSTRLRLPGMAATGLGRTELCRVYRRADGSFRAQLGDGSWLGLPNDLGWLTLCDNPNDAVPLNFSGASFGTFWQAQTENGAVAPVSYTTDNLSPVLTINADEGSRFAPEQRTPSLAAIEAARGCPAGDLSGVELTGARLSGLDFTGTDFTGADVSGCRFPDAILTKARFGGAALAGATFDGADLSGADFAGADLDYLAWGRPKRATRIILTGCSARHAMLGGDQELDCSGATLATGDFTGAQLTRWNLTGADLSGATLAEAVLDHAVLDGATLRNTVAPGATVKHATLRGCDARGADFAHADLSFSDLTRIRMGSRAYLFSVAESFAAELDKAHYAPPDLVREFSSHGVTISDQDPVSTERAGQSWTIEDPAGRYQLILARSQIDVFVATAEITPACLAGATCQGTTASRASMAGVDLRRVRWHGASATLDHADLTGAALVGALLAETDLTQAYLDGADLSEAVLVQTSLRGCLVGGGADGRAFALNGALVQGADFTSSTLLAARLVDTAVALTNGVPLFTLPSSDAEHLTTAGIAAVAQKFAAAGYPLGQTPSVTPGGSWLIDNERCTDPLAPKAYRVTRSRGTFWVFDSAHDQTALFSLPSGAADWLKQSTASQSLVSSFGQNGYLLAAGSPIIADTWWQVATSADAPFAGPVAYPTLRVVAEAGCLRVFGSVIVRVRAWNAALPDGLAFHRTVALEQAIDHRTIGPAGLPKSLIASGRLTWLDFWMAPTPQQ